MPKEKEPTLGDRELVCIYSSCDNALCRHTEEGSRMVGLVAANAIADRGTGP